MAGLRVTALPRLPRPVAAGAGGGRGLGQPSPTLASRAARAGWCLSHRAPIFPRGDPAAAVGEPPLVWYRLLILVGREGDAPTMKALGIDRLSPEQRVALALEIWESLGDAHPPARLT